MNTKVLTVISLPPAEFFLVDHAAFAETLPTGRRAVKPSWQNHCKVCLSVSFAFRPSNRDFGTRKMEAMSCPGNLQLAIPFTLIDDWKWTSPTPAALAHGSGR
jgi:hypothetical protein